MILEQGSLLHLYNWTRNRMAKSAARLAKAEQLHIGLQKDLERSEQMLEKSKKKTQDIMNKLKKYYII